MTVVANSSTLWIGREKYHTTIVLPRDFVEQWAPALSGIIGDGPFVRFGWGDRDYYGSSSKSFYKAFKALVLPSRSVVEVASFDLAEEAADIVKAIEAGQRELELVLAHIIKSFKFDKAQAPQLVRVEPDGSSYYRGRGIYHMWHNCNNWTAKGMRKAGIKIAYPAMMFADWVMKKLD